jgi:serine protease Do
VADISDEQRQAMELDDDHGVLVEKTGPGPARDAGVRQGDIIMMINNNRISDKAMFDSVVNDLPVDKSIPVLIQRRGSPIFLALKLKGDT